MTNFAKDVIGLCQIVPRNRINDPLVSQLIRSSGSVGANYREANEAISKKDFIYRLRTARKEAKESDHWFELLTEAYPSGAQDIDILRKEATELRNILSAIIFKVE